MNDLTRGFQRLLAIAAASALLTTVAHAQTYAEIGDAGSSAGTGVPTGLFSGQPLTSITGAIGANDSDLFYITIDSPALFSATTVGNGTSIDSMIFLFTLQGNPVYLNDDDPGGASLQSTLPANSSFGPLSAGTYILGISLTGVDPVNQFGQRLFDNGTFSFDVRGPAAGATGPVDGVIDSGSGAFAGSYTIDLTGASTSAIPEPSVTALLAVAAVGALGYMRRRNRRA